MNVVKWLRMGVTMAVVSMCVVSMASAADQIRKKDRKKDGTCQSFMIEKKGGFDLAADRTRDRKKDGTCQSSMIEKKSGFDVAANKTRDRKKDGTCQS